mmetsp:Transcript_10861/g.14636  ORF Transcript_10861/g.14636 Transcript_10861/m.14636 type:complete len:97 (+) Transcript_10861:441-731(+)
MRLDYPFGKPKRLLLELFIMINMAQLMYTAMLAFTKTAIVSAPAGTSIVILCLFRHVVVVLIELARQVLCLGILDVSSNGSGTKARAERTFTTPHY